MNTATSMTNEQLREAQEVETQILATIDKWVEKGSSPYCAEIRPGR